MKQHNATVQVSFTITVSRHGASINDIERRVFEHGCRPVCCRRGGAHQLGEAHRGGTRRNNMKVSLAGASPQQRDSTRLSMSLDTGAAMV